LIFSASFLPPEAAAEVDILGMIYLGADHRGFKLKDTVKKYLLAGNIAFEDLGAITYDEGDDYVDFAIAVSEKVAGDPCEHKGILMCGSGHGMDMVANKFPAVRAALCVSKEQAIQSREHEDANILILPSDMVDEIHAKDIVDAWLIAKFSKGERHKRRLGKLKDVEIRNFDARAHFECDD